MKSFFSVFTLLLPTFTPFYVSTPLPLTPTPSLLPWTTLNGHLTTFFGHRGDRVFMPEHTLGSYHFASVLRVEYVEPDLVLTKDGIPVCYHDLELSTVTNVADLDQFKNKRRNLTAEMYGEVKTIVSDWFVEDFTLEELRELRVKQRSVGVRPMYFEGVFGIPTFQEYLDLMKKMSEKLNRPVGLVPELKHCNHFNKIFNATSGHYFEDTVLRMLHYNGFPSPTIAIPPKDRALTRVVLQTFERPAAEYLHAHTNYDIMFLVDTDWHYLTPKGLDEVANFATIVAPWKEVMVRPGGTAAYMKSANVTVDAMELEKYGGYIPPESLVDEVHRRGMRMTLYTFYDSREMEGSRKEELEGMMERGVDGLFVENVAEALEIRDGYQWKVETVR